MPFPVGTGSGARAVEPDRLAELLAAIGNSEIKALLLLSLEDGEAYGVSALHRRYLMLQGDRLVHRGVVGGPQKLLIHSLEPIGLVARATVQGGTLKHELHDPDRGARALAGLVLAGSESLSQTLSQVFGKTAAPRGAQQRSPIRRYDVLSLLFRHHDALPQAEIARRIDLPATRLSPLLASLRDSGLISYTTQPTYEMKSQYTLTGPVAAPRPGNNTMYVATVDVLNARYRAGARFVTRDEIEDALLSQDPWHGKYIRDSLQRVMELLVERRQVGQLRDYTNQRQHTSAWLTPPQRQQISPLLDSIAGYVAGDPAAWSTGLDRGSAIVSDPTRVRALLRKAYARNKLLNNPVSAEAKRRLVLRSLRARPGATAADIAAEHAPTMTVALVRQALVDLQKNDLVDGVRQERSVQKRWYLAGSPPPSTAGSARS